MHVCILTTVHAPFDTRIFRRQATSLAKAGYQVTLLAPHTHEEVVEGVRVIPIPRHRSRLRRMATALRVFRMAAAQNADVYHFHDPELLTVGLLLRIFRRVPVIFDVHEHYPRAILSKHWIPAPLRPILSLAYRAFESVAVPVIGHVVYTTPIVGDRYQRMRCTSIRIDNYPTADFGATLGPASFAGGASRSVVYVGGLQGGRGITEAIEAFKIVVQTLPDARLTFIGNFESQAYASQVRAALDGAGAGSIVVKPAVPYRDLGREIQTHGIGLVTYLPLPNNTSCLPNKLFEYMAAGVPVVASNFPLYEEVVRGSNCGVTVDPVRPEAIAEALIGLMQNPDTAREMGEAGRAAYLRQYNWGAEERRFLEFYRSLPIRRAAG